jgi:type IV pilus assembly protein PilN
MTSLNLLPWREQQRHERNRRLLSGCLGAWVISAGLAFLASQFVDGQIDQQRARNQFMQAEIAKLAVIIREIDTLKQKKQDLLARMEVIQQLQSNRAQIVHVFDDLVHKLPSGVYLESVTKTGKTLALKGVAQSNGRVSNLMRNLDSSDWFDNASLEVVDVNDQAGVRVSRFNLRVAEEAGVQEDDLDIFEDLDEEAGGS